MEILIELVFEFLISILFEILAEIGLYSIVEATAKRIDRNPVLALIGYALLGAAVGGISLIFFPESVIRSSSYHGIGLVTIPLMAGLVMMGVGALRRRKGDSVIQLDSFIFGFVFAFGTVLVRFWFTG
jgi:hypothetical protein